jgi:hypothetical protein
MSNGPFVVCHGVLEIRMRGHDDDGQRGLGCADLLQKLETGPPGHADVSHQDVRPFASQGHQRLIRRLEGARRHAAIAQCTFQHPAYRCIVDDEPHPQ